VREQLTQRANDVRKGVIAGVYNELVSHIETGLSVDGGDAKAAKAERGGEDGAVRCKAFAGAFAAAHQDKSKHSAAADDKDGTIMDDLRKRQAGGVKGVADALQLSSLSSALPNITP